MEHDAVGGGQAGDVHTHERRGGGVRIYFERPWFSSGAGEQVGVVLRRPGQQQPLSDDWKTLRRYVSEWAMDPLWNATERAPLVAGDFANAAPPGGSNLTLEELDGLTVDAVGFEPRYDDQRHLRFCDIEITGRHYFPFVRLALARFHPISVPDAHLSRVVQSDSFQVLPDRTVSYDLGDLASDVVRIEVNGPGYFNAKDRLFPTPQVVAYVERRVYDTGDELGWEPVSAPHPLKRFEALPDNMIWRGDLQLPSPMPSPARIVVMEAEIHDTDPANARQAAADLEHQIFRLPGQEGTAAVAATRSQLPRVVFADTLELP